MTTSSMGKRTVYTKITPLPSNVPRQLAIDLLHNHAEVIQLNPLVTGVRSIEAPRDAASDEFFSQWYEISEIITWGFGLKKKIAFKGVFHDQPWGLQSHVYAPMGVDMRNKYRIGGNQPGEPREARELGLDTPVDGLYLREDVEITCNVPLTTNFVKKEAKAATAIMVDRLTRKAELLDEGKLHAMFEDGKLKTAKPSAQPTFTDRPLPSPTGSGLGSLPSSGSPAMRSEQSFSPQPALDEKGFGRYHDIVARQTSQRQSYVPQYQQSGYTGPDYAKSGAELPGVAELPEAPGSFYFSNQQASGGLYPPPLKSQGQVFRSELPGDFTHIAPQAPAENNPPGGPYQAYKQPSPQPSPRLMEHQSSKGSYRISNPDVQPPPLPYRDSPQSGQVAEWQRGLGLTSSEDPNSIRHSTYSNQSSSIPDYHRFSQMSMSQTPTQMQAPDPYGSSSGMSKCPVCGLFEGDEAAITHHVSKEHFE